MSKNKVTKFTGKETILVVLFPHYEIEPMKELVFNEASVDFSAYTTNKGNDAMVSCLFKSLFPSEALPMFPQCYSGLCVGTFLFDLRDCDIDAKKLLCDLNVDYTALFYGKPDGNGYQLCIDDHVNEVSKIGLFTEQGKKNREFGDAGEAFYIAKIAIEANLELYKKGKVVAVKQTKKEEPTYTMSEADLKIVAKKVQDSFAMENTSERCSILWKPIAYNPEFTKYTNELEDGIMLRTNWGDIERCYALVNIPMLFVIYGESTRQKVLDELHKRINRCYGERLFELGVIDKFLGREYEVA